MMIHSRQQTFNTIIGYRINRKGGGTNADTVQITADDAKPTEYLTVNGLVEGMRRPIRTYSITEEK